MTNASQEPDRLSASDQDPTLIQPGVLPVRATAESALDQTGEVGAVRPVTPVPSVPLYRIGDYELLSEVGRGGMGVVFKARHVRLHRVVALKMILAGLLARPEDLQRFETEAAAAAQLQHPNIVALYEAGTHEGQPYLTMEYVSGSSLAQRVDLGVLPGRLAASYLERLARAVAFAHEHGVIHRDLKPANVLLDESDEPKITDFGLAKVLQSDSGQTRTGAVLGTPCYIAPEQAGGRKDVGPACDVYSLGAILYELLTGAPPFRGETALATLNLVAEKEPVPPRLLNPRIARDLETICLKCLEKDPARRYAGASQLADDLRRYLAGEPTRARRPGSLDRALKWCRRKPAAAGLLGVSILALAGLSLFQWQNGLEERRLRREAQESNRVAQVRENAMRHLVYLAQMRHVQHACAAAELDTAERLLAAWVPADRQPDLRDWEWYYLDSLCRGRSSLPAHAGRATAVASSADGKRLATASEDRTVRLWSAATGQEVTRLDGHRSHVLSVAFSPDSSRLVSAGGDSVLLVWNVGLARAGGKALVARLAGHQGGVSAVAFSPDGATLASAGLDETVRLWDAAAGKLRQTLRGHEGEVMALAFTPDGRVLVSGGGPGAHRGQVRLWEVATGRPLGAHYGLPGRVLSVAVGKGGEVAAGGAGGLVHVWQDRTSSEAVVFRADVHVVYGLAFSPADGLLACAGGDGRVRLLHGDGGQDALRLTGPGRPEGVAFSPDGRLVAACGRGKVGGQVDVWRLADGKHLARLDGHTGPVHALTFSGDSRRLATAGDDRTVRIFDLASPNAPARVLTGAPGRLVAIAWQPRGQLLAAGGEGEEVYLWDAATGKKVRTLPGHNDVLALAYSPDGRWLASGGYDKMVRLWDLQTGEGFVLKGHTGSVNALAFSPGGGMLASGGSDRAVRLWDLDRRQLFVRLDGFGRVVAGLAFQPGGRRLATVGDNRSVRLWDLVTHQPILDLPGPEGGLRSVAFSPDGRSLAAAGQGDSVRIWQAPGYPAP